MVGLGVVDTGVKFTGKVMVPVVLMVMVPKRVGVAVTVIAAASLPMGVCTARTLEADVFTPHVGLVSGAKVAPSVQEPVGVGEFGRPGEVVYWYTLVRAESFMGCDPEVDTYTLKTNWVDVAVTCSRETSSSWPITLPTGNMNMANTTKRIKILFSKEVFILEN
jgi:hypothetical protein